MIKIPNRYELRKGKFGCYFHDNNVMVDMNLEMVVNSLNRSETNRLAFLIVKKNLDKEIFNLKNQIQILKEVNEIE